MTVGDDQLHPRQAAGDQAAQERRPAGAVLGRGDLHSEDLPPLIGVDAGGDQRVHVHRPAALAHLLRQRVQPHERIRSGIQRLGAKRLHLPVQHLCHLAELALGDLLDPELLHQLVHPARRNPQQVTGGHHTDECLFGPAAPFQQPIGEVGARAQLGDGQFDGVAVAFSGRSDSRPFGRSGGRGRSGLRCGQPAGRGRGSGRAGTSAGARGVADVQAVSAAERRAGSRRQSLPRLSTIAAKVSLAWQAARPRRAKRRKAVRSLRWPLTGSTVAPRHL